MLNIYLYTVTSVSLLILYIAGYVLFDAMLRFLFGVDTGISTRQAIAAGLGYTAIASPLAHSLAMAGSAHQLVVPIRNPQPFARLRASSAIRTRLSPSLSFHRYRNFHPRHVTGRRDQHYVIGAVGVGCQPERGHDQR